MDPILIFLFILFLLIFGIQVFVFIRGKADVIKSDKVPGAFSVPVQTASFGGYLAGERGKIGCTLILFEDRLEFNILNNHKYLYGQVKEVGFKKLFWFQTGLVISFVDTSSVYCGYMHSGNLRLALKYFQNKGCKLSEDAQKLLNEIK